MAHDTFALTRTEDGRFTLTSTGRHSRTKTGGTRTVSMLAVKYVTERRAQGRFTGTTPATVTSILGQFCDMVGRDTEPAALNRRHFEKWIERPKSITTKRNQFSIVRAWVRWMVECGYLRRDATLGVRAPRQPRKVAVGMTREQVSKLFAALPDVRAEVIALLMLEEGLRCGEVAALEVGDVDLYDMRMLVHGKGGHERELPLCAETASAIRRYLAEDPCPAGPLVRSYARSLKALSPGYISSRMRQWMFDAGLRPEKVGAARRQYPSAHSARHTCARDLVASGANLRDVQTVLGHTNLQTTSRYVGLTAMRDLRDVMEGRDYRQRGTAS